ncbi:DltE [Acidisarcina polymorpha]|uniref:DltE n=1 Tax=Acidisarcina polymorpha TaxID=2211140 RepID=A0A2Z5G853_9BACT|nr:DltE [Acidisarcina polymorpha]
MKISGNTVLITGGGSGIGRGLAEAFHRFNNRVIIAGRREGVLQAVASANAGMEYLLFDQDAPASTEELATKVRTRFPNLNVLVNNAGIQKVEDLTSGDMADAEAMINTNLLGLCG